MRKILLYIEIFGLILVMFFTYFIYLNFNDKLNEINEALDYATFSIDEITDVKGVINDVYYVQYTMDISASYLGSNSYPYKIIFTPIKKVDSNITLNYEIYYDDVFIIENSIENYNQEKIVIHDDILNEKEYKDIKIIFLIQSDSEDIVKANTFSANVEITKNESYSV